MGMVRALTRNPRVGETVFDLGNEHGIGFSAA